MGGGLVWWWFSTGVVGVGGVGGCGGQALPCGHAVAVARHRGQGQRIRGTACRRYLCLWVDCV